MKVLSRVQYDRERNVFENAIVSETTKDKYVSASFYEIVNNLLVNSTDFLDGIIELDTRIISAKDNESKMSKHLVTNL